MSTCIYVLYITLQHPLCARVAVWPVFRVTNVHIAVVTPDIPSGFILEIPFKMADILDICGHKSVTYLGDVSRHHESLKCGDVLI